MKNGIEHTDSEDQLPIECFRCGICCIRYQPKLTDEDIDRLARGLALSVEGFLSRYTIATRVGYLLRQSGKGCIFLSCGEAGARASCNVYPFRPEACRNWAPSSSHPECREGMTRMMGRK